MKGRLAGKRRILLAMIQEALEGPLLFDESTGQIWLYIDAIKHRDLDCAIVRPPSRCKCCHKKLFAAIGGNIFYVILLWQCTCNVDVSVEQADRQRPGTACTMTSGVTRIMCAERSNIGNAIDSLRESQSSMIIDIKMKRISALYEDASQRSSSASDRRTRHFAAPCFTIACRRTTAHRFEAMGASAIATG